MNQLTSIAAAAALALTMSGCVIVGDHDDWDDNDWQYQQRENRETIATLDLKMERKQVLRKLGAPNFSEAFAKDGKEYRVLYYRTQHRHADGDTTKDETTPLVFEDDILIGWGEDILDQFTQT